MIESMSLSAFLEEVDSRKLSLVLVNRNAPDAFAELLEDAFGEQTVGIEEMEIEDETDDMVYLVEETEIVASSPLEALQDSILLVNSDLYMTGTRDVEDVDVPDVIEQLEETRFSLRGYPESNKEKFILITISRHIERIALESEGGTHRASFQRLSRINDEQGTRDVYEKLGATDTDVHVYGIPDWTPPPEFGVTMHGSWSEPFQKAWFVLYLPDDESSRHAALLAIETEPRVWESFWTHDRETVREINRYLERKL